MSEKERAKDHKDPKLNTRLRGPIRVLPKRLAEKRYKDPLRYFPFTDCMGRRGRI